MLFDRDNTILYCDPRILNNNYAKLTQIKGVKNHWNMINFSIR